MGESLKVFSFEAESPEKLFETIGRQYADERRIDQKANGYVLFWGPPGEDARRRTEIALNNETFRHDFPKGLVILGASSDDTIIKGKHCENRDSRWSGALVVSLHITTHGGWSIPKGAIAKDPHFVKRFVESFPKDCRTTYFRENQRIRPRPAYESLEKGILYSRPAYMLLMLPGVNGCDGAWPSNLIDCDIVEELADHCSRNVAIFGGSAVGDSVIEGDESNARKGWMALADKGGGSRVFERGIAGILVETDLEFGYNVQSGFDVCDQGGAHNVNASSVRGVQDVVWSRRSRPSRGNLARLELPSDIQPVDYRDSSDEGVIKAGQENWYTLGTDEGIAEFPNIPLTVPGGSEPGVQPTYGLLRPVSEGSKLYRFRTDHAQLSDTAGAAVKAVFEQGYVRRPTAVLLVSCRGRQRLLGSNLPQLEIESVKAAFKTIQGKPNKEAAQTPQPNANANDPSARPCISDKAVPQIIGMFGDGETCPIRRVNRHQYWSVGALVLGSAFDEFYYEKLLLSSYAKIDGASNESDAFGEDRDVPNFAPLVNAARDLFQTDLCHVRYLVRTPGTVSQAAGAEASDSRTAITRLKLWKADGDDDQLNSPIHELLPDEIDPDNRERFGEFTSYKVFKGGEQFLGLGKPADLGSASRGEYNGDENYICRRWEKGEFLKHLEKEKLAAEAERPAEEKPTAAAPSSVSKKARDKAESVKYCYSFAIRDRDETLGVLSVNFVSEDVDQPSLIGSRIVETGKHLAARAAAPVRGALTRNTLMHILGELAKPATEYGGLSASIVEIVMQGALTLFGKNVFMSLQMPSRAGDPEKTKKLDCRFYKATFPVLDVHSITNDLDSSDLQKVGVCGWVWKEQLGRAKAAADSKDPCVKVEGMGLACWPPPPDKQDETSTRRADGREGRPMYRDSGLRLGGRENYAVAIANKESEWRPIAVLNAEAVQFDYDYHMKLLVKIANHLSAALQRVHDANKVRGHLSSLLPRPLVENIITIRPQNLSQMNYTRLDRKIVTILNADLRGFTNMSRVVGDDDMCQFIKEYYQRAAKIIRRPREVTVREAPRPDPAGSKDQGTPKRGTLDKFMGDGILALFGDFDNARNPVADEMVIVNGIARALACGFEIIQEVRNLARKFVKEWILKCPEVEALDQEFGIGVALHTGMPIVGLFNIEEEHLSDPFDNYMTYTAIGQAVNTVSRLNSQADVDTLWISEPTRRLLEKHVDNVSLKIHSDRGESNRGILFSGVKQIPPNTLKGISHEIKITQVQLSKNV